ncbi:hypothetical protein QZH41_006636 [Actinostola sp. cb2023]|nr:hypothetical protein QZH41_006636 [Actinostola sp. cb2023]
MDFTTRVDYPHLEGLELADYDYAGTNESDAIDILIGSDHYWDIVTGDIARGDNGPTAISSELGWLLSGRSESTSDHVTSNLIIARDCFDACNQNENDEFVNSLKSFWETESIGINDPLQQQQHDDDGGFVRDIRFNGERYEVRLPWKENCPKIDNDYELCRKRLTSLHNKLKKDPELLRQ